MNKYRAKKVKTEDGTFDSQAEYKRWCQLKLLEKAGEIHDLRRQVKYPLDVNGHKICSYISDFTYRDRHGEIVEDYKGVKTQAYRLKAKLMKAVHGINVMETGA